MVAGARGSEVVKKSRGLESLVPARSFSEEKVLAGRLDVVIFDVNVVILEVKSSSPEVIDDIF